MSSTFAPRGVYLITPDEPDTARLLARTRPLLPHVALLQYRNKAADGALQRAQAEALQEACSQAGVPLLINGDIALARAVGAAGVHLPGDGGDIRAARDVLGAAAVIGISCYDELARAERAAEHGASYLSFGAFFASPSKRTTRRAPAQLLHDAAHFGLPRAAIGGITPDTCAPLIAAGAELIATISSVYAAPDPLAAVQAYRRHFGLAG